MTVLLHCQTAGRGGRLDPVEPGENSDPNFYLKRIMEFFTLKYVFPNECSSQHCSLASTTLTRYFLLLLVDKILV